MPPPSSTRTSARLAASAAGVAAGTGAAVLGAGLRERHRPVLRRERVPVLASARDPRAAPSLSVLHVTDTHTSARQRVLPAWVHDLGRLVPDLVVVTGDVLGGPDALPTVLAMLDPLLHRPGAFVEGNNDPYSPQPSNPVRYLTPGRRHVRRAPDQPADDLRAGLAARGWVDAGNARHRLHVAGRVVDVVGLGDPTLRRDRPGQLPPPPSPPPDVTLGLVHTPATAALDVLVDAGADLLLAGHTHGGQVRLPGVGALTSNCDLPRHLARGLGRWRGVPLHVSAGVGTSPWLPVRLGCRPEATLLTLVPRG